MIVDIAKLRALCDAATPGPWRCDGIDIFTITDSGKGYPLDRYPDSVDVSLGKCQSCGDRVVGVLRSQDEDFIVAARDEMPALLDEVERLRETLAHSCEPLLAAALLAEREETESIYRSRTVGKAPGACMVCGFSPCQPDSPDHKEPA